MAAAADWLERQAPSSDRYLLFVDEFDPHEPFDTPERWASLYDPDDSPRPIWPPYAVDATARGVISPADLARVRAAYGAKLSMIDHHLGRVLDVLDRQDAWDDTAVDPVHRPRALPRRARRGRQAGGAAVRADEPHPAARRLARRRARARSTR